jgi:hypothetical protein
MIQMEASDTSGDQPDNVGGQDAQPEAASSQEQPTQDSQLATPQPDQPVPTEAERQESASEPVQDAQPVEAQSAPDPAPQRDQYAEEAQRQADLAAQRDEHNERTGGGQQAAPSADNADNAEQA